MLRGLWEDRTGVLSTQVLQDFYVNATRKNPVPLARSVARHVVEQYAVWSIVEVDVRLIVHASELEERYQLSFWDALVVAAARRSNASLLLSEDLNAGQVIEGVRVEDPLPH